MLRKLIFGVVGLALLLIGAAAALTTFDLRFQISSWRIVLAALMGMDGQSATAATIGQSLQVRPGYVVALYASNLPKARMLRLTATGDLLVSQPRLGQISVLGRDANGDGLPDRQEVLIGGLDRPNGIDLIDGWLYIAEGSAVGRVRFDVASGRVDGSYQRILSGVPEGGNHWTRTLRAGPDGWLYLSIGSSCNVCVETHAWRAAMIRFRADGSAAELFASGLRNSVGFDWAPWSGELFATDNGRDLLGDDFPPCELNRITAGGFYGWPHLNGFGVADPDLGAADAALLKRAINPAFGFRAHNAPLGIRILRSTGLPAGMQRSALVALHGSWNRSTADGYKVVQLRWDDAGNIVESDFLSGFERNGNVIGRPVDIAEAPDGRLFISDDYAGAIYRVNPSGKGSVVPVTAPVTTRPRHTGDPLKNISSDERAKLADVARRLMQQHACVSCHIPGTPTAEKWGSLAERYTLAELTEYFLTPTPPMPVLPLSADQRRTLAVHLLATGGY
jgi:glucose/arabinose dehydrogenase